MDPLPHLRSVLASAGNAPEPSPNDSGLIIRRDELPVHRRRVNTADALGALIQCFLLEASVDIDDADALVAPTGVTGLEAIGLLRREGTTVRAVLRLTPHASLLIAHDTHQPGDLREVRCSA